MSIIEESHSPRVDDSEQQLIERSRNNDYRAYEQLYRLHVGRVFAVCVRLLNDRDLAEDITQETFVTAWKKLSSFRGDSAFGTWIHRIATNTALSLLRREKHFRNSLDIEDVPEPGYTEMQAEQIGLEQAISELPDGARTVFVLYSIEGYTHDEIADLLDIATGSSKAQLHRARQLLRALLDGKGESNGSI